MADWHSISRDIGGQEFTTSGLSWPREMTVVKTQKLPGSLIIIPLTFIFVFCEGNRAQTIIRAARKSHITQEHTFIVHTFGFASRACGFCDTKRLPCDSTNSGKRSFGFFNCVITAHFCVISKPVSNQLCLDKATVNIGFTPSHPSVYWTLGAHLYNAGLTYAGALSKKSKGSVKRSASIVLGAYGR